MKNWNSILEMMASRLPRKSTTTKTETPIKVEVVTDNSEELNTQSSPPTKSFEFKQLPKLFSFETTKQNEVSSKVLYAEKETFFSQLSPVF